MQRQEIFDWPKVTLKRYYKYRKHRSMAGSLYTDEHNYYLSRILWKKMWDKCASSVLSIVCRTHLSHFQFVANMNVYEHIGHTSWDKCAPRQMCSYTPHPKTPYTLETWDTLLKGEVWRHGRVTSNLMIVSRMGSNPVRCKPLFPWARNFTLIAQYVMVGSRNGCESVSLRL
jgi:hypothetical protein